LLTHEGDLWEVRKLASEIWVVRGTRMIARSGGARGDGVTARPVSATHANIKIYVKQNVFSRCNARAQ
jgi:transcriptional regulator of acetoin/glycerol metabolism